ncbi:MAG: DNA-processing protein DprA [Planctomycetota bacterium]|nr:DNA-processing protein DprA [Planctomycetota bacterium]
MARNPGDIDDATMRIALAVGLGPVVWGHLRAAGLTADEVCRLDAIQLGAAGRIGESQAQKVCEGIRAADPLIERAEMTRIGARAIVIGDDDYPDRLSQMHDPPIMLWIRGRWEELDFDAWWVALVGSRLASDYGVGVASTLGVALGDAGCVVVSGGARGIDAASHRGALRARAPTVAVVGSGLGQCYPPEHARLYEEIVASGGAMVSELPCAAEPLPHHFPRRNRILAGLSHGVVVVEASLRSGALITARLACDLGRDVVAVPGRVGDWQAHGCHKAIREGWAMLAEAPEDILQALQDASGFAGFTQPRGNLIDSSLSPTPHDELNCGFLHNDQGATGGRDGSDP